MHTRFLAWKLFEFTMHKFPLLPTVCIKLKTCTLDTSMTPAQLRSAPLDELNFIPCPSRTRDRMSPFAGLRAGSVVPFCATAIAGETLNIVHCPEVDVE